MKMISILSLFFLLCLGCTNREKDSNGRDDGNTAPTKFEQTKWNTKAGDDYPYRDEMLDDLIANVKLKGMKHGELKSLLGQPDRVDSCYLFYRVSQKRIGFFPLHTKTLVVKFNKDSTVEWRKIHE